ncbi:phosphoglycerate dehydrogenase [Nakamurella antarctica]|uniref:Phosphoglycerate dehydrogenase n=1 Tax=Nakamurella antarctica TaxID=1902245 RepID=A0A3G8ZQG3_9ACTN|nr:phosphoglycerate dehydrogenase [Nakamurella antarctica]
MTTYVANSEAAGLLAGIEGVRILTSEDGLLPNGCDDAEIYVPEFLAGSNQVEVLQRLPNLKLVQLLTAGAEVWTPHLPEGVVLCTARGAHGGATAEWAVGALIAVLQEFAQFARNQMTGRWDQHVTDRVEGKRVLVVGAGDLGEQVRRRLLPFGADVTMVARTARAGIESIHNIASLLPHHQAVIVVVPVTPETVGLVDADFLAAMPDGAVLVNAARGSVVKTDALLLELTAGRLFAALDVTDPEPLPVGHPLWGAPGVFITPHIGGSAPGALRRAAKVAEAQIRRYLAGEQLLNVVSDKGY